MTVPHFLSSILGHLSRPECLKTDGLFRKAGSAARQKRLKEEIEAAETFDKSSVDGLDISLSALDCACLLKQWLRELPEPLIPVRLHDTFLKCCHLSNSEDKVNALLLSTLLLPPLHSASLACLMRFLSKVAINAANNKMNSRNLALVFTPGLFHSSSDEMAKGGGHGVQTPGNSLGSFNAKLDVIETLIDNASKVCMIECAVDEALTVSVAIAACNFTSQSEDNLDAADHGDDADFAGPSARRRKKKKRRSGSLSRVLTAMKGIHKAISRTATPAGTRSGSTINIANSGAVETFEKPGSSIQLSTPDFLRTPDSFNTPCMLPPTTNGTTGKRKGPELDSLSSTSKQSKGATTQITITPVTPQVTRGRSISLKGKFKRKKTIGGEKENSNISRLSKKCEHVPTAGARNDVDYFNCTTTPLPSKPTFTSLHLRQQAVASSSFQAPNTPGTPNSFGLPSAAQDLSGFGSSGEYNCGDSDATSSIFNAATHKERISNNSTEAHNTTSSFKYPANSDLEPTIENKCNNEDTSIDHNEVETVSIVAIRILYTYMQWYI